MSGLQNFLEQFSESNLNKEVKKEVKKETKKEVKKININKKVKNIVKDKPIKQQDEKKDKKIFEENEIMSLINNNVPEIINKDKNKHLKLKLNINLEDKNKHNKTIIKNDIIQTKDKEIIKKENILDNKVINNKIEKEDNQKIIMNMFEESETDISLIEEWKNMYNKGLKSTKNTIVVKKLKKGRFRIKIDGSMEILPDIKTKNISINNLFNMKWI